MLNKNLAKFILYSLAHGRKKRSIWFVVVLALFALFGGVDDKESVDSYLDKLQSLSEYRLDGEQKRFVSDYYLRNKNRNPSKVSRHKLRAEFNAKKGELRREWSARYSLAWPVEISSPNSQKSSAPARRQFEAHHIIPINAGGTNVWQNIAPLSDENHKKIHASIEERACFSHDLIEQKLCRLTLKIREAFYDCERKLSQVPQGLFGPRDRTQSPSFAESGVAK